MNDNLWLSYILFSCPYKLTSKDKLVASYLTFVPQEDCSSINILCRIISDQSGLKIQTVQKSLGRLRCLGLVVFTSKKSFELREGI